MIAPHRVVGLVQPRAEVLPLAGLWCLSVPPLTGRRKPCQAEVASWLLAAGTRSFKLSTHTTKGVTGATAIDSGPRLAPGKLPLCDGTSSPASRSTAAASQALPLGDGDQVSGGTITD
jgi:hypothetical protein